MIDTGRVHVLLADDHPVVRAGLRTMLESDPKIEVVGEVGSGEEAVESVALLEPQVVLMDIRMPGMNGMEATRRIKSARPAIGVIVLTMYDCEMYVVEAIRAGAAGYLVKDSSRELLCHAIHAVADGGTMVRSTLLRRAIHGLLHVPEAPMGDANGSAPTGIERFTSRELDVVRLMAQGFPNKRIAHELSLAEVTVKKHVQSIIGKLGVSDRTHAAIMAVRLGLAE